MGGFTTGKPPSSDDDGWSQYEWGKNDIIEMIEKIVETYADKEWAFIYEPLQNAFDSFYVSDSSTATNGYVVRKNTCEVEIDPTNNRSQSKTTELAGTVIISKRYLCPLQLQNQEKVKP